jgi:hypothetical protein
MTQKPMLRAEVRPLRTKTNCAYSTWRHHVPLQKKRTPPCPWLAGDADEKRADPLTGPDVPLPKNKSFT